MKYTLAVIALCAFVWSCKSTDNPVTPAHVVNYFPTSVGSWWKYNTWSDSAGVRVAGSDTVEVDSVVAAVVFQGRNAIQVSVNFGGPLSYSFFSIDSSGDLWQFVDTTAARTGSGFWLVRSYFSNTKVGAKNTEQFPLAASIGAYHVSLLFNATLTNEGTLALNVPAGAFSTNFRADSAYADGSAYFPGAFAMRRGATYYADGCGIVKDSTSTLISAVIYNRNSATVRELAEYHVIAP